MPQQTTTQQITTQHAGPTQPGHYPGFWRVILFVAIGIVLPVVALLTEAITHLSSESLFDPVPTPFHMALVAIVPLSNAWLLHALARGQTRHAGKVAWLNAVSIGIAFFYALLYLPITPLAVLGILWFGIGLLPLAPLLALITLFWGRRLLKRFLAQKQAASLPNVWRGMLFGSVLLVLLEVPTMATGVGLHMANSDTPAVQLQGIRWLRAVGNQEALLRRCYERTGTAFDPFSLLFNLGNGVSTEQARAVFYRVTGKGFNQFPAPKLRSRSTDFFAIDQEQGGEVVGSRTKGVALANSSINGSLDAQAGSAYLEWTMLFKNSANIQNEGRGQILLPPGAVVSRLTLWIDGEEREAAFGGRSEVRQAYEKVVRQRRDPVLVTTQGKDRILFQLFPIPPNGGEMKVRIGMTVPLTLPHLAQAQLQLPALLERNFDLVPGLKHQVWLEAKTELSGLPSEPAPAQAFAVRGAVEDGKLGRTLIQAARNSSNNVAWSRDPKASDGSVVVQHLQQQAAWQPKRVVLVLDGSLALRDIYKQLADALSHLPREIELGLVIAGDEVQAFLPEQTNPLTPATAMVHLKQFQFEGGRDNLAALQRAWDWALTKPGSAIVWVHGPQPILFNSPEVLNQMQQRRPQAVKLFQLEAVVGPNVLLEKIDIGPDLQRVATSANPGQDLQQLFRQWQHGAQQIVVKRERLAATANEVPRVAQTSDHIARLWAADEVSRLAQTAATRPAALELALRYQLVTSVSGAVVLETRAQYQDAGLEPVAAGSVPTIPEPETWLLIALVLVVLGWQYRHRVSSPHVTTYQPHPNRGAIK
jgi:Vault protein inter-alpha-trypsin domain